MAVCSKPDPILKGSTISGTITSDSADLEAIDFFLLFYVDRRKPTKIAKSDMSLAEANVYNWSLASQVTAGMDSGQHIGELCLENSGVIIKRFEAFSLEDSESAKFL